MLVEVVAVVEGTKVGTGCPWEKVVYMGTIMYLENEDETYGLLHGTLSYNLMWHWLGLLPSRCPSLHPRYSPLRTARWVVIQVIHCTFTNLSRFVYFPLELFGSWVHPDIEHIVGDSHSHLLDLSLNVGSEDGSLTLLFLFIW